MVRKISKIYEDVKKIYMSIYRKILLLSLVILSFASQSYALNYVPGDIIIVLKPSEEGVTASSLYNFGKEAFRVASFASESGAWVKNTYSSLSETGNNIYALIHSDHKDPAELSAELLSNPEVLAASPNYMVHAAVIPDDTRISSCWYINYINAPAAWDIATGNDDVYVAIIDSGIDYTNPDLSYNVALDLGSNIIRGEGYSTADDYGHGSHVAGIIGAIGNNSLGIAGVNWNVQLIPIKVLDSSGSGTTAGVMSAIDYVTWLIQQGVNIRAVNLSLEAYLPIVPTRDNLVQMPLWRAFKTLDELNKAVIIVAAGNQGVRIGSPTTSTKYSSSGLKVYDRGDYVYPPSFEGLNNMISVSASDAVGRVASFSNRGANISAPGVNILSTWLQSSTSYVTSDGVSLRSSNGTSMAAPQVAGAVALLSSIMPDRTAYQLKQAILFGTGTGILDVRAAIDYQAVNNNIPVKGTQWPEYDNYNDYNEDPKYYNDSEDYDSSVSSGSCSGEWLNMFALILLFPLARKSSNC